MAGFALAAALAIAPAAHAQLSCDEALDVMGLAFEDFDPVIGEEVEDGLYEIDFWLDDAAQCYAGFDDFSSMYACMWLSESEEEGDARFRQLAGELGACLAGWERSEESGDTPGDEYTTLRSLMLFGVDDDDGFEWVLSLDRHDGEEGTDWHVSLASSLYW